MEWFDSVEIDRIWYNDTSPSPRMTYDVKGLMTPEESATGLMKVLEQKKDMENPGISRHGMVESILGNTCK